MFYVLLYEQPIINYCFSRNNTLKVKNKYSLRNNNYLKKPFCPTKFNQYRIAYLAPYLWNKIVQPNLDTSISFSVFKNKLKNIIFSTDYILKYF